MLCHDPRISNDASHKVETENPALMAVEFARQAFPDFDVDWLSAAVLADYCEQPVRGPLGSDYDKLKSLYSTGYHPGRWREW